MKILLSPGSFAIIDLSKKGITFLYHRDLQVQVHSKGPISLHYWRVLNENRNCFQTALKISFK